MNLTKISKKMADIGLRERSSQTEMLESVFNTLQAKKILCIEAPTGTGKTLAYSLGALAAKKEKQTLVISTATTALQEQFLQKDLALIEQIHPEKFNVVLAKGRRRYVCHERLFNPEPYSENELHNDKILELQALIEQEKWQGEADNAPITIAADLWQRISTDSNGCTAQHCAYFNDCLFFQNRRKMEKADIVVTNHSLLLSDLELGGGVILPKIEESIYILDECHHLPEKALSHFAKQAAVLRSFDWINTISKTLNKAATFFSSPLNIDEINSTTKDLVENLREAKNYLDLYRMEFIEKQWRIKTVDPILLEVANKIIASAKKVLTQLKQAANPLDTAYELAQAQHHKELLENISRTQSTLKFIITRCENLMLTWRDLHSLPENTAIPFACWFETNDNREENDFTLHTSPINVSTAMQTLFWEKITNGVILCSATIRAMGKFNDFLRKLGLKDHPHLTEQALTSPFHHQHSLLFVPSMKAEPNQIQQMQHLEETVEILPKIIFAKGGTLVLFTSRKAMEYVFDHISQTIKKDILAQTHYSKILLIQRHQEKIDRGQRSIIFGLASFAEGIDLPGEYCQHVIIQKLPFTVPSDPISQTRADWLKQHRRDPFQLVTLPETSIKLAQYIGRLLRHEEDKGVVTILDKRLYTKQYGANLLASLPNFTRLINNPIDTFLEHAIVKNYRV